MRSARSLRGRVALLATVAVAAILTAVGAAAVASFADGERDRLDEALAARPARELLRALAGPGAGPGERPAIGPAVLRPEGEYVRVIVDGAVLESVDAPPVLPVPDAPGLRTLDGGGDSYRSLARPLPGGVLLEVGRDLAPVRERVGDVRRRLLLLGALGVVLVAGLSWWLAGLALRPLEALRAAAGRVGSTRDLSTRVPEGGGPEEVEALAGGFNAMLGRLERSAAETDAALDATRRFAADAGHELRTPMTALRAGLGTLRRNPGLDAGERAAIVADAEREAERAARLLEALQTLARGDAGATLPRGRLDLADVVEAAVESARARHPSIAWRLGELAPDACLDGWPDGLRALVDNLLENAARHGRPRGTVEISLERDGGGVVLTVDDDGPGVPVPERRRVLERFSRGAAARGQGSGLGLALVRQQARIHGGDVAVEDAPLGGARLRVRLGGGGGAVLTS